MSGLTWIIGQGGLLGSALSRNLTKKSTLFRPTAIDWTDPATAHEDLARIARTFTEHAGDGPWRIVWAAGNATVSSSEQQTQTEVDSLAVLANTLAEQPPKGDGHFFLVSSAGGVYAGSHDPPFTERDEPRPLTAYGRAKLAQEDIAQHALTRVCPVTVGRVSNLYGPGQRLDKLQGVISRLCLATVTNTPVNIFVPLSTVRDYLEVDDAASIIATWLDVPADRTVLIASGLGTSLGQLLRITQDVVHRKVPVAMGTHPSAAGQAQDLRFIPTPLPAGRTLPPSTPLPVGVKKVFDDILRQRQAGAA